MNEGQRESNAGKAITNPSNFTTAAADADGALAAGLLRCYYAELAARFPGGFDLGQTVAAPAAELRPPFGAFLVVWLDGEAVGCGAARLLDATTGEIKRMWVAPSARGRGVGRRLLAALEAAAASLGCRRVRLDTSRHLSEALHLYHAAGYQEIPPYNDNPYADYWLEKALTEAPQRAAHTTRATLREDPISAR